MDRGHLQRREGQDGKIFREMAILCTDSDPLIWAGDLLDDFGSLVIMNCKLGIDSLKLINETNVSSAVHWPLLSIAIYALKGQFQPLLGLYLHIHSNNFTQQFKSITEMREEQERQCFQLVSKSLPLPFIGTYSISISQQLALRPDSQTMSGH